jgi:ABC-type polysaccharide/polyol phosphate transport system ATPase subunit
MKNIFKNKISIPGFRYQGLSKRKFFKLLESSLRHKSFFDDNVDAFFKRLQTKSFPNDKKILITLKDISKHFPVPQDKPNVLFDKVNIQVKRGDVISLVGANGVGKSTLLDILVGYLNPNSGDVEYDLKYNWSPTEKIGISYQKNVLLSSLSV